MDTDQTNNLLTDSRRKDYSEYGVKLYTAAMSGDWETAVKIHKKHPNCFIERITKRGDTALHIAAVAKQANFVTQLVPIMAESGGLALENTIGNTALCFAASSGMVAIAEAMVNAQGNLPSIRNKEGMTPLRMAALLGHRDMVNYLLECTSGLLKTDLTSLFISVINTDLYDIALKLLKDHPDLAKARDDRTRETPLHVLAKKSHEIPQSFWRRYVNRCISKKALHTKLELVKCLWEIVLEQTLDVQSRLMIDPWRMLFVAVEVGNVEFVVTLINRYPDLVWKMDEKYRSIFHVAVQFRQETIFRLIFEIGAIKDLLVTYTNVDTEDNILHLAAMIPSSDRLNCVSGAALQMQREMLWFEVVENIVQPRLTEAKNRNGKTAKALFTEQHKELRHEGEEWLRKTAGSCSVVATLIAGVVFGAALKIPESEGAWHLIFAISDSLSLISSTASILMFLSIMTSRYAEKDFLTSLPRKLMVGLGLLFFSIATMMIAFTATFDIVFKHGYLWILIAVLASIPIFVFVFLEFPLLMEVFRSTIFCNSIFESQQQLFPSQSRIRSKRGEGLCFNLVRWASNKGGN